MNLFFLSEIKWISPKKGGRLNLPKEGVKYCPIIDIKNDKKNKWSIEIICPDFSKTNIISFRFLSKEAPVYEITKKCKYSLYEGRKEVAEIVILNSKAYDNDVK